MEKAPREALIAESLYLRKARWRGEPFDFQFVTENGKLKTETVYCQTEMSWTEAETSTHQDHVIKHVLGATVLGWVIAGEAAHLLLDIGFLWSIYLDGEMNLLPQGVAIAELEGDDVNSADRTELAFDADLLASEGRHATDLKRFTAAPVECLIQTIDVQAQDSRRRIIVRGEVGTITVETSIEGGDVRVRGNSNSASTHS